jgi:hypothetical protein
MKLRPVFIAALALVALLCLAYWLSTTRSKTHAWQFVPPSAFMVWQLSQADTLLLKSMGLELDPQRSEFLLQRPSKHINLISIHPSSKEFLRFLIVSEASGVIPRKPGTTTRKRKFSGYDITELDRFVFAEIEGVHLCSNDALVLEEAIRTGRAEHRVFTDLPAVFSEPTGQGNTLFVNGPAVSKLLSSAKASTFLTHLLPFVRGQAVTGDTFRTFAGNILTRDSLNSIASIFQTQEPVLIDLLNTVPNSASLVYYFGISDKKRWRESLGRFRQLQRLRSSAEEFASVLYDCLGAEMISFSDKRQEVLLIRLTEPETVMAYLEKQGAIDLETYGGYTIKRTVKRPINFDFLWPLTSLQASHYCIKDDVIIVSSLPDEIRDFLDHQVSEEVWGKSPAMYGFLQNALRESNAGVVINYANTRDIMQDMFTPSFYQWVEHQRLSKIAIQISATEKGAYFHSIGQVRPPLKAIDAARDKTILTLPENTGVWYALRSHLHADFDFFIEESAKAVSLYSFQGKPLWRTKTNGNIVDRPELIDFFRNRKLQYAFVDQQSLHVIDRLGRYLMGFPKRLDVVPSFFSVVDYDRVSDHRFLTGNLSGDIFLLDKKGNALPGWAPKKVPALSTPPVYMRLNGKDCFVFLHRDGSISIVNRRGEPLPNFPVRLPSQVYPGFCRSSMSGRDILFLLGERGQTFYLDTSGTLTSGVVLPRGAIGAKFGLVESNSAEPMIARKELGKVAIFRITGDLLFEMENPLTDNVAINSFSISPTKQVFILTDLSQSLSIVVDDRGRTLGRPISTTRIPELSYSDERQELLVRYLFSKNVYTGSYFLID